MIDAHEVCAYSMRMPKKAVNLSIDADLLAKAREEAVNLSSLFEEALKESIREKEERRWREENKKAIDAYNEFVGEHGVFAEGFRSF